MNVSDVLTSALGLLGVLREGESVSAEQGADGLIVFNDLVASLREQDIDLPIPPMAGTTTALTINEGDAQTLKALMAVNLSPNYPGRQLNPVVIANASAGYQRWQRDAINRSLQPKQMNTISKGTDFYRRTNIITGI